MAGPAGQNGKMTKRDAEVNRTAATRSWWQKRSQSECSAHSIELQKSNRVKGHIFTFLRELVMKFPIEILGLSTAAFNSALENLNMYLQTEASKPTARQTHSTSLIPFHSRTLRCAFL